MTVFGSVLVAVFTGISIWILTKQDGYCITCSGMIGTPTVWGWGTTGNALDMCTSNFQVPRRIEFPSEPVPQPDTDSFATLTYNSNVRSGWNSSSSHYSYGFKGATPMSLPMEDIVIDGEDEENRIWSLPNNFPQVACPTRDPYRNATKCCCE